MVYIIIQKVGRDFFFRQTVQIAHEVSIEQQNSTKLPLAVKKGALVDQVSNTLK